MQFCSTMRNENQTYFLLQFLKRRGRLLLAWGIFLVSGMLTAQVKQNTIALKEVILSNASVIAPYFEKSATISVINQQQLQNISGAMLTPLFNQIPGVQMQQGNWNTNRITIRGIGARTPFGTTKIKSYWNDIPLTSAEGETVLEDLDVNQIQQVNILKGPNAVNYGAGMGGVIVLQSKITNENHRNLHLNQEIGSFGLWRNGVSFQERKGTTAFQFGYRHQSLDGFRENSNFRRDQYHFLVQQEINPKHSIQAQGLVTDVRAFIPSSINLSDATNQPWVAAANWGAAKGFEDYQKNLFGITHQYFINKYWLSKLTGFHQSKKSYEPRPFDILNEIQSSYGWRWVVQNFGTWKKLPVQLQFGWEHQQENYQFDLYRNLYIQFPGQGSIQGDWFQSGKQWRNYHHWFIQTTLELTDQWKINADAAYHLSNYRLEQNNLTSSHAFRPFFAPRIATTYQFHPNYLWFLTYSKGFSTPTVAESLTANGDFNTNLLPETAQNIEIGLKWKSNSKGWNGQINYYYLPVSDILVAERIAEDQFEGRNAGKSLHQGLEWESNWHGSVWNIPFQLQYAGSWNHMKFVEFIDSDQNFSRNRIPGVPSWQQSITLASIINSKLLWQINYRYTGQMPLNDANSGFTDAFSLVDVHLNYQLPNLTYWKSAQIYLGVHNLLDVNYTASIVPNAMGVNQNAPRFYYPGMPIQFFGGFRIQL